MTAASCVGGLQLLDETRVNRDFAARHAPGVNFGRGDNVDVPLPSGSVGTERTSCRDQPARYGAHAVHLGGVAIQGSLLRGSLHRLCLRVSLHCGVIHLGGGQNHRLLAIDPDRPRLEWFLTVATRQRQRQQEKYGEKSGSEFVHGNNPRGGDRMSQTRFSIEKIPHRQRDPRRRPSYAGAITALAISRCSLPGGRRAMDRRPAGTARSERESSAARA